MFFFIIFALKAIDFFGTNGLLYGNIKLVGTQLIEIVPTVAIGIF
ncbi:hypothetical protein [Clostridium sp.]